MPYTFPECQNRGERFAPAPEDNYVVEIKVSFFLVRRCAYFTMNFLPF